MVARGFSIAMIVAALVSVCCAQGKSVVAPGAEVQKLAGDFQKHFEKAYGNKNIDPEVAAQCPK